jgi:beta-lactamase superfamily II metal-dependent hydrolase
VDARTWLHAAVLAALAQLGGEDARPPQPLRIAWIDAEGGAATLVVTPAGEALLVDAGWPGERDARRIADAARAAGVDTIDHCVITHYHTDHLGGVADLARLMPIARFYDPGPPRDPGKDVKAPRVESYLAAAGGRRTVLRTGDVLPLRGVHAEVVCADGLVRGEEKGSQRARACTAEPPHATALDDDLSDNVRSVGLLLELGDFRFLALADLPWKLEHALVCPVDRIGPVDVLQASHHGHHDSNDPVLLAALRPTVTVVNNGPTKGCTPEAFPHLSSSPGLQGLFQLHRSLLPGARNTAPARIANDAERCAGEPLWLTLAPERATYTLEIRAQGTRDEYAVRSD